MSETHRGVLRVVLALLALVASAAAWGQAGTLVFTSATYSVDEQTGPGFVVVEVARVGGTSGTISTLLTTSNGTATAPADYAAQSVTLTFLDGAVGPATIAIPIVKDGVVEDDETFTVNLTGGAAGALNQTTVTIQESPGTLVFTSAAYSVDEQNGPGFVVVSVARVGGVEDTISTTFTTSDGSATAPADYQAQTITLTFLAGAVGPATIAIPIVKDSVIENNETFDVHLSGGRAGVLNQATVTILESPGTLEFTSATYNVLENAGFVVVGVQRVGGTDDTISTLLTTSNGSATAPADYQAQSVTLTFLAGAVGPATIAIPIVSDALSEGSETFGVQLTGGQASGQTQATVTIVDPTVDVAVSKSAPASVLVGSPITYSLGISNQGTADAPSVVLSDALPAGTLFSSLIQNSGPAFACSTPAVGGNGLVTCNAAILATGASATFSLTVNTDGSPGQITNTATGTTSATDITPSNNNAAATTTLSLPQATPAPALSPTALFLLILVIVLPPALASRRRDKRNNA